MVTVTELLESIHRWDVNSFHRSMHARQHKPLVATAYWTSKTADGWFYPAIPLLLYLFSFTDVQVFFYGIALAFACERTIYLMAKKGFKRKRPSNILPNFCSVVIASDEFSFPSGHTSAAFLTVTTLTLLVSPTFALLYLWSIAVGCSRVILGVHFPTDTLVGAILGTGSAAFALNYMNLL